MADNRQKNNNRTLEGTLRSLTGNVSEFKDSAKKTMAEQRRHMMDVVRQMTKIKEDTYKKEKKVSSDILKSANNQILSVEKELNKTITSLNTEINKLSTGFEKLDDTISKNNSKLDQASKLSGDLVTLQGELIKATKAGGGKLGQGLSNAAPVIGDIAQNTQKAVQKAIDKALRIATSPGRIGRSAATGAGRAAQGAVQAGAAGVRGASAAAESGVRAIQSSAGFQTGEGEVRKTAAHTRDLSVLGYLGLPGAMLASLGVDASRVLGPILGKGRGFKPPSLFSKRGLSGTSESPSEREYDLSTKEGVTNFIDGVGKSVSKAFDKLTVPTGGFLKRSGSSSAKKSLPVTLDDSVIVPETKISRNPQMGSGKKSKASASISTVINGEAADSIQQMAELEVVKASGGRRFVPKTRVARRARASLASGKLMGEPKVVIDNMERIMKDANQKSSDSIVMSLSPKKILSYAMPIPGAGFKSELPSAKDGVMPAILKTLGLSYVHQRFASEENSMMLYQIGNILIRGFGEATEGMKMQLPKGRTFPQMIGTMLGRKIGDVLEGGFLGESIATLVKRQRGRSGIYGEMRRARELDTDAAMDYVRGAYGAGRELYKTASEVTDETTGERRLISGSIDLATEKITGSLKSVLYGEENSFVSQFTNDVLPTAIKETVLDVTEYLTGTLLKLPIQSIEETPKLLKESIDSFKKGKIGAGLGNLALAGLAGIGAKGGVESLIGIGKNPDQIGQHAKSKGISSLIKNIITRHSGAVMSEKGSKAAAGLYVAGSGAKEVATVENIIELMIMGGPGAVIETATENFFNLLEAAKAVTKLKKHDIINEQSLERSGAEVRKRAKSAISSLDKELKFKQMASGGFTGFGEKYDPAGIVHKGEYVIPKEAVDKIGVGSLNDMFRGYAKGGHVKDPLASLGDEIGKAAGSFGLKDTIKDTSSSIFELMQKGFASMAKGLGIEKKDTLLQNIKNVTLKLGGGKKKRFHFSLGRFVGGLFKGTAGVGGLGLKGITGLLGFGGRHTGGPVGGLLSLLAAPLMLLGFGGQGLKATAGILPILFKALGPLAMMGMPLLAGKGILDTFMQQAGGVDFGGMFDFTKNTMGSAFSGFRSDMKAGEGIKGSVSNMFGTLQTLPGGIAQRSKNTSGIGFKDYILNALSTALSPTKGGGIGGALLGSLAGASVGTMFGGLGGAIPGSILGGVFGYLGKGGTRKFLEWGGGQVGKYVSLGLRSIKTGGVEGGFAGSIAGAIVGTILGGGLTTVPATIIGGIAGAIGTNNLKDITKWTGGEIGKTVKGLIGDMKEGNAAGAITGAMAGAMIGGVTFLGGPLGAALGGVAGAIGLRNIKNLMSNTSDPTNPINKFIKDRISNVRQGGVVGGIIGGVTGAGIGLMGGPAGAALGGLIGATVGSVGIDNFDDWKNNEMMNHVRTVADGIMNGGIWGGVAGAVMGASLGGIVANPLIGALMGGIAGGLGFNKVTALVKSGKEKLDASGGIDNAISETLGKIEKGGAFGAVVGAIGGTLLGMGLPGMIIGGIVGAVGTETAIGISRDGFKGTDGTLIGAIMDVSDGVANGGAWGTIVGATLGAGIGGPVGLLVGAAVGSIGLQKAANWLTDNENIKEIEKAMRNPAMMVITGAIFGAMAGMSLGPYGAAGGAIIGGLVGTGISMKSMSDHRSEMGALPTSEKDMIEKLVWQGSKGRYEKEFNNSIGRGLLGAPTTPFDDAITKGFQRYGAPNMDKFIAMAERSTSLLTPEAKEEEMKKLYAQFAGYLAAKYMLESEGANYYMDHLKDNNPTVYNKFAELIGDEKTFDATDHTTWSESIGDVNVRNTRTVGGGWGDKRTDTFNQGGFTGFGKTNQVAGRVHAGEWVIPAERTSELGLNFLNQLTYGNRDKQGNNQYKDGGFVQDNATKQALKAAGISLGGGEISGIKAQVTSMLSSMRGGGYESGGFVSPILEGSTVMTSAFGSRPEAIAYGGSTWHEGIDLRAKSGAKIGAILAGDVYRVKNTGPDKSVTIRHKGGLISKYLHLSSVEVSKGDTVAAGQLIGYSGGGTPGKGTGAHLHLETRVNGKPVNPEDILTSNGIEYQLKEGVSSRSNAKATEVFEKFNSGEITAEQFNAQYASYYPKGGINSFVEDLSNFVEELKKIFLEPTGGLNMNNTTVNNGGGQAPDPSLYLGGANSRLDSQLSDLVWAEI